MVGFGFRTGALDLSDGSTPPDVLAQCGFDESWTGLYLPEIRLFVAPNGARDLAVDAGARNLLIGIGESAGITGDFDLTVLNQRRGTTHAGGAGLRRRWPELQRGHERLHRYRAVDTEGLRFVGCREHHAAPDCDGAFP